MEEGVSFFIMYRYSLNANILFYVTREREYGFCERGKR
jgi:hypothetical protein